MDRLRKLEDIFFKLGFIADSDVVTRSIGVVYQYPNETDHTLYFKDRFRLTVDEDEDPIEAEMEDLFHVISECECLMNFLRNHKEGQNEKL